VVLAAALLHGIVRDLIVGSHLAESAGLGHAAQCYDCSVARLHSHMTYVCRTKSTCANVSCLSPAMYPRMLHAMDTQKLVSALSGRNISGCRCDEDWAPQCNNFEFSVILVHRTVSE
jgi:hypothetical protein